MNLLLKRSFKCAHFLAILTLTIASTGRMSAAESPAPVEYTAEQKALLQALDTQLAQFEERLTKDENVAHAASVKETLDALKQRRDILHRTAYEQNKYDELRYDLNVAYQRLNLWLAAQTGPHAPANPKARFEGTSANTPKSSLQSP